MINIQRFQDTIDAFDKENAADPNKELVGDKAFPKELLYAQRMTECLASYAPDASESLQLAARCQHIRRWEIPRASFPTGKKGYLLWRTKLKERHAAIAGDIMFSFGYDEETIKQVKKMLLKRELKADAEVQILQDVACLVFLMHYFNEFKEKHTREKIKDILEKTMRKMSGKGIDYAKELDNATDFLTFLE